MSIRALRQFAKSLQKQTQFLGLNLKVTIDEFGECLRIQEVPFFLHSTEDTINVSSDKGYLIPSATTELNQYLKDRKAPFLTEKGELFFPYKGTTLHILPDDEIKISVNRRNKITSQLSHTSVLSPLGIQIVECVLRTNDNDLRKFRSALAFCQAHGLNQSRMSKIMKAAHGKDLISFKKKIKELPLSWWELGFEIPAIRRHLRPFVDSAKSYHSLQSKISPETARQQIMDLYSQFPSEISWGPAEVAIQMGLLRERDLTLWCTPKMLTDIKKRFKLVSGVSKDSETFAWNIAVGDLDKDAILMPPSFRATSKDFRRNLIMRAAWDLSFFDERRKEARMLMLREVINGIQF